MTRLEIAAAFADKYTEVHNERNKFMDDMISGLQKIKDKNYAEKLAVIEAYCNTFMGIDRDYKRMNFLFDRLNEWASDEDAQITDSAIVNRELKEGEAV